MSEHGPHCEGCRQLGLIADRAEAIAAAKAAFAALPEKRRRELGARFDLATLEARQHASYTRNKLAAVPQEDT